jgi:hypothetical protein
MHKTSWNITFEQQINFKIENLHFVESLNPIWTYTYFFYWKTYIKTSIELLQELEKIAWVKYVNQDISISTEDDLDIYTDKKLEWVYTMISIEWAKETFKTVVDKFKDSSPFIVSIRESVNSPRFGNRIVKVDIVN